MTNDLIALVREVADPDKEDPLCSQGDFITLTPEELARLVRRVVATEHQWFSELLGKFPVTNANLQMMRDVITRRGETYGHEAVPREV